MKRENVAAKVYGALTRLYPRRFRREYGRDMVSLFRDQCRDESMWRVLPRTVVDLALTIPTQHLEAGMRRDPNPVVALIYLAISLAGLCLAIMGGTEAPILILGLVLAVGAGALSVIAWRRGGPVRDGAALTDSWWKFLVGGPSLVALVLGAAALGVEAWLLGMTVLLVALVSTALGVVLGLSHLFTRRTRTA